MTTSVPQLSMGKNRNSIDSAPTRINPFGSMEFLEVWWNHNRESALKLNYVPLHAYLQKSFCVRRAWKLVDVIEACGRGVADYTDLDWRLISPAQFRGFLQSVLQDRETDLLVFPRLIEGSVVADLTSAFARDCCLPLFRLHHDVAPYTLVDGGWETYYTKKSKKFRYNLRRAERKLVAMGGLEFLHVTSPDDIERYMCWAFQLHARRSANRYRGTLWLTSSGQKLLTQLALRFAVLGWMDLTFLLVGGQPIAFCYGFHNEEHYYFYSTSFDPDPHYSSYSPGMLLIKHLLRRAFDSSFQRFDFMLGKEPYKNAWATHHEDVYTYLLGKPTVRSRATFFLYSRMLHFRQRVRRSARLRSLVEKALLVLRH